MEYERKIGCLLRRLGVNSSYKGFLYTVYGACRAIHDPELLTYISKGLYVEIACRYQTSVDCVERDIRTVVKTIWEYGDRTMLNEVFGFDPKDKPCNKVFIDAVAHYAAEHDHD